MNKQLNFLVKITLDLNKCCDFVVHFLFISLLTNIYAGLVVIKV